MSENKFFASVSGTQICWSKKVLAVTIDSKLRFERHECMWESTMDDLFYEYFKSVEGIEPPPPPPPLDIKIVLG